MKPKNRPNYQPCVECFKAGFQLREILRCRKFSLSFFSIVSDHAELMFKIQKKPCEIFRQRNISRNWKPTFKHMFDVLGPSMEGGTNEY